MRKSIILLMLLLGGIPVWVLAFSNEAAMLRKRQLELINTDSADVLMNVSERLKATLEKEGDEELFYKAWYSQITYVLDNISTSKALNMIDEIRDYAEKHDSKYGFFIVSIINAHIAKDMGLSDRAEELLLGAIDYQKRYLPNIKPMTQLYYHLARIYEGKHQGEKAIRLIDEALKQKGWSGEDYVVLWSIKCNAATCMEPVDTTRFMGYYKQLHDIIDQYGYNGNVVTYTECYHAQYTNNYPLLLKLAQKIINKGDRLKFKIAALDGLNMNQEAIDSFRVYKAWTEKQFNADTRKMTEMSTLELEAARAEDEANTLRLTNQKMMLIVIVCGLILFSAFLAIYLHRRQRQMRQLRQAYDKLEEAYGQLEQVTTQKEHIESELRIARNIQLSMAPKPLTTHLSPLASRVDIFASMTPAKTVGGDLYDFFVRDDQLFFCIGDVSGKGVPAALFMMMTKSLFRAYSSQENMPESIVTQMNQIICENNKNHMFVTLLAGVLDLKSGLLRYCNAGHEPPIVVNEEATFLPLHHIFPIGFFPGTKYVMQEVIVEPGTTILLYTDGVNEAKDADENMFSHERIVEEVNKAIQSRQLSPKSLIDQLTQSVHQFVGDTEQSDDLTMLSISYSE